MMALRGIFRLPWRQCVETDATCFSHRWVFAGAPLQHTLITPKRDSRMLFHECIPANRHVKRSVPPCWAGSFRMNAHAEKKVTAHQFGIDRTFGS